MSSPGLFWLGVLATLGFVGKEAIKLILANEYASWAPALARLLVRAAGVLYPPRRAAWLADLAYVQRAEKRSGLPQAGSCLASSVRFGLAHAVTTWVGRVRRGRAVAVAIAGFLAVTALPALVVYVPPHLIDTRGLDTEKWLKAENDLRTTLVQAVGGTVLLIGVYFTWRRRSAAERSNEIAREGQITERFTRAIGSAGQADEDKLDIRLGGTPTPVPTPLPDRSDPSPYPRSHQARP
jgi:hypothetical protein